MSTATLKVKGKEQINVILKAISWRDKLWLERKTFRVLKIADFCFVRHLPVILWREPAHGK